MKSLLDPRSNDELFGHSAAEMLLRRSAAGDRLHHAWLLTGAEGIGKATLAYRFARALLAGLPNTGLHLEPEHPVFRQVAAGSHPDVVTIALGWDVKKGRDRKEIVLDDTERLFGLFAHTAANGGWRIVVVDGVDYLNRNASNALLKLLEEPPEKAIFLMTSSAPSRLPKTLRSRCILLPLRPLDDQNMRRALQYAAVDGDANSIEDMIRLGEGAPGKALRSGERPEVDYVSLDDLARATAPLPSLAEPGPLRALIHRQLRDGLITQDTQRPEPFDRRTAVWCSTWSSLGQLDSESLAFNLDKDQVVLDMMQAIHR